MLTDLDLKNNFIGLRKIKVDFCVYFASFLLEPLFNEMSLHRENSYGSTEEQDTSGNILFMEKDGS